MDEEQKLTKRERKKLKKAEKQETKKKEELKKSSTQKLITVGLIVAFALGLWFFVINKPKVDQLSTQNTPVTIESVNEDDRTFGPENADVVLMEYADFQCPGCALYAPYLTTLREEYKDNVTFVYRYFPLNSIHKNAQLSSQAAEAASKQNKFWEMSDKLYEKQKDWENSRDAKSLFEGYASELGLDVEKFKTDIVADETRERVNRDYRSGITAGINSTPTFILNGKIIESPQGLEPFREVLNTALLEASASATVNDQDNPNNATSEGEITPSL